MAEGSRTVSRVEQDYRDALERLLAGIPENPKLKAALSRGARVLPNKSNVALEAGRSRTPLAVKNGPFPAIVSAIEAALCETEQPKRQVRTRKDYVRGLREENKILRNQLRLSRSENAALSLQLVDAVEAKERAERALERLAKQKEEGPPSAVALTRLRRRTPQARERSE